MIHNLDQFSFPQFDDLKLVSTHLEQNLLRYIGNSIIAVAYYVIDPPSFFGKELHPFTYINHLLKKTVPSKPTCLHPANDETN